MISCVTPSVVSATGWVKLTSLASMAQVAGFGELANRRILVKSRSIVHDGVGIALMWLSTSP